MNIFKLDLGDWSDDGHGKTETFYIQTDATLEEIQLAYVAGCNTHGICMHASSSDSWVRDRRYVVDRSKITLQLPDGYQEFVPEDLCEEISARTNLNFTGDPESYRDLFLWLVMGQLPSKTFTVLEIPSVLHSGTGNFSMGYNLFN